MHNDQNKPINGNPTIQVAITTGSIMRGRKKMQTKKTCQQPIDENNERIKRCTNKNMPEREKEGTKKKNFHTMGVPKKKE